VIAQTNAGRQASRNTGHRCHPRITKPTAYAPSTTK